MWRLKWPRKRLLDDTLTEYTTHIVPYGLGDATHRVILTVHLPSGRVSEKHYDTTGYLKKYIHSSSIADQHIEYLCAQDNELREYIKVAESMQKTHDATVVNNLYWHRASIRCIKSMLLFVVIWGVVWGLAKLIT